MSKLQSYLEEIRKKPYAVRQRYAVVAAVTIVAVILGGWWGVRLGLERVRQDESSVALAASPWDGIRRLWQNLVGYVETTAGQIDTAFDDIIPGGADSSPTPAPGAWGMSVADEARGAAQGDLEIMTGDPLDIVVPTDTSESDMEDGSDAASQ